jgi:acyl carrier protein
MNFDALVAGVLEVEPEQIVDDASQDTLASWTSMRHIELVVTLQEAYRLSFSYDEINGLRTIGDLRGALAAKGVTV